MEAATTTERTGPSGQSPELSLPPEVTKAAEGKELTNAEEASALDFLLGPTRALEYDLLVDYETPEGIKPLTFHFRQQDAATIDELDAAHRKGEGPFARLDVPAFNAAVAARATLYLVDASGRRVDVQSEQFRGGVPNTEMAMALRFKYQPGILEGVAAAVRSTAGYGGDRVGTAQRSLVEAGKD